MRSNDRLGVCYYPEHWPEAIWPEDAKRMTEIGICDVRIGEFAWSRIEPARDQFNWGWLDRAIDTLHEHGLNIIFGTPTATPPKWLIDAYPEILANDRHGNIRKFGSRRHYCFSSERYREESSRIVEILGDRYGKHDGVVAWQTDNEFGCHNTVRSYSSEAARAFRKWLAAKYKTIEKLNTAWGTVFWSQEYASFEAVELPHATVTEPNPSHVVDFFRFSSDQVVSYHNLQSDILRRLSPGRDILHNFMGFFFDFDHFALGAGLDIAGWDSYPLGFLDVAPFSTAEKKRYMRQGHPDFAGFFHDLYRACGKGRWQVLEQQPGPVNWAPNNPRPLPGMVRLWTHEAFAHGAEAVSYFRWRQAPFAEEQMHAGLQRPDRSNTSAVDEVQSVESERVHLPNTRADDTADVAIVFSYDANWIFETQPQGAGWSYPWLVFNWYSALRRFGVDVDFVSPSHDFGAYKLLLVPSLPVIDQAFVDRVEASGCAALFGPRTGSKTPHLTIPESLAPGLLRQLIPITVLHSESFPAAHRETAVYGEATVFGKVWLDHIETEIVPSVQTDNGIGLYFEHGVYRYLATVPGDDFLERILVANFDRLKVPYVRLPDDLRTRRRGDVMFAFNYGPETVELPVGLGVTANNFLVGGMSIEPAGVSAWHAENKPKSKPGPKADR